MSIGGIGDVIIACGSSTEVTAHEAVTSLPL